MDANSHNGAERATRFSAALSRARTGDDTTWRRTTEAANAAYATGDLRHAIDLYREALDEAERLFAAASFSSVPVPVIYNISCHNLAEIVERSGDEGAAEDFLVRAYDKLLASAASPETPLPLRLDCVRHLKHALAQLVQHLRRRAAPDARIARYVDTAKTTAFAVFHAAKHAEIADLNCDHCAVRPS
ncbi:hypothetical protein [Bradyrhizobium prioriisuperbiae]|uniref:hypothetical protein n=1 Tax=Bradyrhizobium prioriisuperbiae TaxID=2854389 RepID=UPI0028EE36B5|nr:hypothetical protein [Bradyrhizobium prioritasuperba]